MTHDGPDTGPHNPGEAQPDLRQLLRRYRRQLDQIRADQARVSEQQWSDLFRQIELILRQIFSNPRLVADPEIDRIGQRMLVAPDMEALNFELRLLAERLGEMLGTATGKASPARSADDSRGLVDSEQLRPNGRMRLRL